MNGIIIVNQTIGHNDYKIKRFVEEYNKLHIDLKVYINDGTLAKIENGNIIINLPSCDFVLYLDKDIYLARMLEKAGYLMFNKPDFIKLCDDKVLTYISCANKGIKMIKTFAGPLVYCDVLEENNFNFLNNVSNELGFPLIVKKVYGSLGEGVYIANNYEELRKIYSKIYRNPLLFQQYMSNSCGKSMRVLVIDNKVVGAFERFNTEDFRSNFGNTASSRVVEPNSFFLDFAQNIANLLNIEYAGIDLLYDSNNDPILCEINSNAFFEEFEKVTGINVAKLHAEMVIKKVDEQKQKKIR